MSLTADLRNFCQKPYVLMEGFSFGELAFPSERPFTQNIPDIHRGSVFCSCAIAPLTDNPSKPTQPTVAVTLWQYGPG